MNKARTIDGILFEALYHADRRASALSDQEAWMYNRVREDIEKYGGFEAARDRERAVFVHRLAAIEVAGELDDLWPRNEETGEQLPAGEVPKPPLVKRVRAKIEELVNGYVPMNVAVKLLNRYLAVRREYDREVQALVSKAGISDERRPLMRERFDQERQRRTPQILSEAAPYKWGRTSLVLA